MPFYRSVGVDYEAWSGEQPVFRTGRERFRPADFRQNKLAEQSDRQLHFERPLSRLARSVGTERLPLYVRWNDGREMRLDRGCVGHALARGFIAGFIEDEDGFVSHVILNGESQ